MVKLEKENTDVEKLDLNVVRADNGLSIPKPDFVLTASQAYDLLISDMFKVFRTPVDREGSVVRVPRDVADGLELYEGSNKWEQLVRLILTQAVKKVANAVVSNIYEAFLQMRFGKPNFKSTYELTYSELALQKLKSLSDYYTASIEGRHGVVKYETYLQVITENDRLRREILVAKGDVDKYHNAYNDSVSRYNKLDGEYLLLKSEMNDLRQKYRDLEVDYSARKTDILASVSDLKGFFDDPPFPLDFLLKHVFRRWYSFISRFMGSIANETYVRVDKPSKKTHGLRYVGRVR